MMGREFETMIGQLNDNNNDDVHDDNDDDLHELPYPTQ